jgi:hypothetical protein
MGIILTFFRISSQTCSLVNLGFFLETVSYRRLRLPGSDCILGAIAFRVDSDALAKRPCREIQFAVESFRVLLDAVETLRQRRKGRCMFQRHERHRVLSVGFKEVEGARQTLDGSRDDLIT